MGFSRFRRIWPSFTARFLKLSAANILSNLMVPLASLVDTAFLGHLSEIHYLGGVALATVLFNYLYWSFGFLRMGTTGLAAQAAGRASDRVSEREGSAELWLLLGRSVGLAIAISLVILLLQWPIQALGFRLLGASAAVQAAGVAFFQGRIWGAPAVLVNFVLLGWFLGQGQGRRVLVMAAIANGANILLDYAFVVRLGWASFGAGLATALSQYLALGVGAIFVWRAWRETLPGSFLLQAGQEQNPPRSPFAKGGESGNVLASGGGAEKRGGSSSGFASASSSLGEGEKNGAAFAAGPHFLKEGQGGFWRQLWHWPALKALFALNRDILIRTFALVTAFSLFTSFSATFGETVLAANALLLQVVSIAAYFIDGFAFTTEAFAGQFAADAHADRRQQLLRLGLGLSLVCGLGFGLLFQAVPSLFGLLTYHQPVLAVVAQYSLWLLPVLGIGSLAYLLDGYFLGLTAGAVLRNASLVSTGVFFLPMAVWAWQVKSAGLLWGALSLLMLGRVVTLGWALRRNSDVRGTLKTRRPT